MKTRRIKVIKLKIEDKKAKQINFDFSEQFGGHVITGTDLKFAKYVKDWLKVRKKFRGFF